MRVIGIDPGKKGCLVLLNEDGSYIDHLLMPLNMDGSLDAVTAHAFMRDVKQGAIEYVNAFGMPNQSSFVFGQGWGGLRACLEIQEIPYELVRPTAWLKSGPGMVAKKDGESKAQHQKRIKLNTIAWAMRLYPKIKWPKAFEKRSGLADAIGVARHVLPALTK